jgi:glycosyltransferase involved in cell wall biosynthesis
MGNKQLPLVTIGIPTYNGGARIHRSLESIRNQNYPNLEIIISDNCSTDNTQQVVENFLKQNSDIKYFRQPKNIGQIPNYHFLKETASGKYFMWVADDDMVEPGLLLRAVAFMEEHDDYSLVAGKIQYWKDGVPDVLEQGFTFEQDSPRRRVAAFYSKVIYCGLLHGLMRLELAKALRMRSVIGNDYHFVANMLFLGKVKNFDFTGYNKSFGGVSQNFKKYAKHMGESWIFGYFPHWKIASDAFKEVESRSPVFASMPYLSRLTLGMASFFGVLYCFYGRIYIGARLRNHVFGPIASVFKQPAAKT